MTKRIKNVLITVGALAAAAAAAVGGMLLYLSAQLDKVPAMTALETLAYTTRGREDAVITAGTIKDGVCSYTVYGEDARELPHERHVYEIGSLTKTFTAALVCRGFEEGALSPEGELSQYLDLPQKPHYPALSELLTHTSGYKAYYYAPPMTGNFFAGRNDFCGIGDSMVLDTLAKTDIPAGKHGFVYSNFGYAALGLVLEKTSGTEFTRLMNGFTQELGLENTRISDGSGDLGRLWEWTAGDTYMAAGALVSDIEDMLKYAQLQLDGEGVFARCHESMAVVNASDVKNKKLDINLDEVGAAWIIDRENGFIWHNGGTGDYNCWLGVCPQTQTAAVVMSNLSPSYRLPATVTGVKLLKEIQ